MLEVDFTMNKKLSRSWSLKFSKKKLYAGFENDRNSLMEFFFNTWDPLNNEQSVVWKIRYFGNIKWKTETEICRVNEVSCQDAKLFQAKKIESKLLDILWVSCLGKGMKC